MALDVEDILRAFDQMTILELAHFSRRFQERYGVTATPPMILSPARHDDGSADADEAEAVPVAFDVVLTGAGSNRINVIRAVRELTGLGLTEARDVVNAIPALVKENVTKEEAEAAGARLDEAGGTVEIRAA